MKIKLNKKQGITFSGFNYLLNIITSEKSVVRIIMPPSCPSCVSW